MCPECAGTYRSPGSRGGVRQEHCRWRTEHDQRLLVTEGHGASESVGRPQCLEGGVESVGEGQDTQGTITGDDSGSCRPGQALRAIMQRNKMIKFAF